MERTSKYYLLKDSLLCTIFTFIISGFLLLVFSNVNFLGVFDYAFKDFNYTDIYYSRLQNNNSRTDQIILVNVGNADRLQIANAIENVKNQKPKVIGLDMVFRDLKNSYADSVLKTKFRQTPNIVTAFHSDDGSIIDNHDYFEINRESSGYVDMSTDDETSVIRNFVGVKTTNDTLFAFPIKLAIESGIISKEKVLTNFNRELAINYSGNQSRYLQFDLKEIIDRKDIPAMKNAIILFGFLGNYIEDPYTIEDKHFSPLNQRFAGRSFPDMFGLVIQANILESLISKEFIYTIPSFMNWLIVFTCCWILIAIGMRIGKKNPFIFDLGVKVIQLVATIFLLYFSFILVKNNIHLNVTPIIFLSLLGLEMICFYTHSIRYIKSRWPWKSYILD